MRGETTILHHEWAGPPRGAMLYAADQGLGASARAFDPRAYSHATPVAQGGRQAAWFVRDDCGAAVLRHYRRGGLIARISDDAYVWRGAEATRSFAEFRIMARLHDLGLCVPQPLAAAYWRCGPLYRADLLTRRVPGAQPLAALLGRAPLPQVAWAVVAMHRADVWHADLNAYNILVDDAGEVWLIDFDRATRGRLTDAGREANLQRLARSLRKVGGEPGQAVARDLIDLYRQAWQA